MWGAYPGKNTLIIVVTKIPALTFLSEREEEDYMDNRADNDLRKNIEKIFISSLVKRFLLVLIAACVGLGIGVIIAKNRGDTDDNAIVNIVDDEIVEENYILTITKVEEVLKPASELITTKYHYKDSDSYENYKELFGYKIPFTTDKVVFTYDGVISVGVDLAEVEYEINNDDKTITIELPEIKILANELDESSFKFPFISDSVFNATEMDDYVELIGRLKEERAADLMENTGFLRTALDNTKYVIEKFLTASDATKKYEVVFK